MRIDSATVIDTWQFRHVKEAVDRAFIHQTGQHSYLTANANGKHGKASKHNDFLAWDFRVWIDYDDSSKGRHSYTKCQEIATHIRANLGQLYDVVVELQKNGDGTSFVSHIHVEYDP